MEENNLQSLIQHLYDVRQQKKSLEKEEAVVLLELKPLVDPKFDSFPDSSVFVDGLTLTRSSGSRSTVSADRLREHGIPRDVLEYATTTSHFVQYRVSDKPR